MGVDTRRPPLPAPTDVSSTDNTSAVPDDLATNITTQTDKTSYSVPEDGSPITITTKRHKVDSRADVGHGRHQSQTSLLIEYFEGGKNSEGRVHSRPSVRVRVTPSGRKHKTAGGDHIQITETGKARKPSYTRRISLGSKREEVLPQPSVTGTEASISELSGLSGRPPVEVEVLQVDSDLSTNSRDNNSRYIGTTSDISSMPPDSMLAASEVKFRSPRKQRSRSRSLERIETAPVQVTTTTTDTLKTPSRRRSRSLSRERITQKVMEKLAQDSGKKPKYSSSRDRSISKEQVVEGMKSPKRRSSKGHREDDSIRDSNSLMPSEISGVSRRSDDSRSIRSGVSGASSINNPKLLQTVEDAIRRIIMPELTALKEEQQTQKNRSKFDTMTRDSVASTESYEDRSRRVSKSSSAPKLASGKPTVVLNRDGDYPGTFLHRDSIKEAKRKIRKSSRESTRSRDEPLYERATSEDTIIDEEGKVHRRRSKDKSHRSRDAALAGAAAGALTAAALKHHDSQSSMDKKEKRRKRTKSRSASVSESVQESRLEVPGIPPLPMQSELASDLTRDSLLSDGTELPPSKSSQGTRTPTRDVREVSRGSPREVTPSPRTPTRTPVSLQKGIGTLQENQSLEAISPVSAKSSRSSKAKAAGPAAAGLGGATLLAKDQSRKDISMERVSDYTRELSPIQSVGSYREDRVETPKHDRVHSIRSEASASPIHRKAHKKHSSLSVDSLSSLRSTDLAQSKYRPHGVNLETTHEVLGDNVLSVDDIKADDADEWFEREHERNEQYRSELGTNDESFRDSLDDRRMTGFTDDSLDSPNFNRVAAGQDIRGVGFNPEYVHTPVAVESAVASLHEPSSVSVKSSRNGSLKDERISQSHSISLNRQGPVENHGSIESLKSQERWGAIRNRAEKLHGETSPDRVKNISPVQSAADEPVKLSANAIPAAGDILPDLDHYVEDEDITTNPSIIQGPIGGTTHGDRSHWPYEPTPPRSKGNLNQVSSDRDIGAGGAALLGGATGLGLGLAAAHHHNGKEEDLEYQQPYVENYADDDYDAGIGRGLDATYADHEPQIASPGHGADEGYISGHPGAVTPIPFRSKAMSPAAYPETPLGEVPEKDDTEDPFTSTKHLRHMSGMSAGMASPLYDSATGKGIDRIQSKDIVALMDHLTVRDAQRNARDTEILVTLVRSAAEMRNSFEEMKRFIEQQDRLILGNIDRDVELTQKVLLQGPRPQPGMSTPRVAARQTSLDETDDLPAKRKNVFRRALKGLSMRNTNDLAKIEDMLTHLLGEVEGLKEAQGLPQQTTQSTSLNSYEALRAAPDPGYEPEGHAGTSSSPNHSGYLSNPSSRHVNNGMHSGFDARRASSSGHRISTVVEEQEHDVPPLPMQDQYSSPPGLHELEEEFEDERLLTPTQEARGREKSLPLETPPEKYAAKFGVQDDGAPRQSFEQTPKTYRSSKHKSNSSSFFSGFPRISRWSKTTASSVPEPTSAEKKKDRPYSGASRSGSDLDVGYYDGYGLQEDDRLRSQNSLQSQQHQMNAPAATATGHQPRSPSPLIPEQHAYTTDDPKYQAHRNSLNLQHPQPRPGPTHRHQTYLESQAVNYDPGPLVPSDMTQNTDVTDDAAQWGSAPALAHNRNLARVSGGASGMRGGEATHSPVYSDGGYSAHSASEQTQHPPARPPKIRDDAGPLVPPKVPLDQGVTSTYTTSASHNTYNPPASARGLPASSNNNYSNYEYSSPSGAVHLAAPLAPIEEVRYSLETERSLTPGGRSRGSLTPSPQPRVATQLPVRKITGPRSMPKTSGSGVRRKPISAAATGPEKHKDMDYGAGVRETGRLSVDSYHSSESETF